MKAAEKPVMVSGIAPSGNLCIGNYAGALRNWVQLQASYDCLFIVVDMHAITVRQDPSLLLERSYKCVALYLACGIDPSLATIFVQSHVPAHSQLAWILNCYTYMGELNRMTQYKDKSQRHSENVNAGLFSYPVLMAADILLYRANLVPVGDDQKQHLELTRDIAQRFNHLYERVFTIPEPYIPEVGHRIMSLQDPQSKMSKSDTNLNNIIDLLDAPENIQKKIARSVTDSGRTVYYDEKEKPGISNLMSIFATVTEDSIQRIQEKYKGKGYAVFKKDLAEAIIEFLNPIQTKYDRILDDRQQLTDILSEGARRAQNRAQSMLERVHQCLGFIPR